MNFNVPLYGPNWFNGVDTVFDVISAVAAAMVWLYARRVKRLTGDPSCSYLGNAFLLISISFVIKVITNVVTYLDLDSLGNVFLLSDALKVQVFLAAGYFVYRLCFLIALIWLVCIGLKIMDWRVKSLFAIFAAIGTLFSHYAYVVFHFIALMLLIYIVASSYGRYKENQNKRSAMITLSFFCLLLAQVMFLFVGIEQWMYVIGESLQLLAFCGVIYNQITLPCACPCFASSVPIKKQISGR